MAGKQTRAAEGEAVNDKPRTDSPVAVSRTSDGPRCASCANAEKLPPNPLAIGAPPAYECHGAPPQVIMFKHGADVAPGSVWPIVPEDWFCGMWRDDRGATIATVFVDQPGDKNPGGKPS